MRTIRLSVLLLGFVAVPGFPPPANPDGVGDPNGDITPNPVSNEQRMAELEHVQQMIAGIPLNGDPTGTEQIAGLLSGMAEFQRVEIHDENVVAQFADGETLVVLNNRSNEVPEGVTAPPADTGITKASTSR